MPLFNIPRKTYQPDVAFPMPSPCRLHTISTSVVGVTGVPAPRSRLRTPAGIGVKLQAWEERALFIIGDACTGLEGSVPKLSVDRAMPE
jgi:hypothetical protein